MPRLRFDQLLPLYRATTFSADGATGDLKVAAEEIKQTLVFIDGDDDARDDSGLGIKGDPTKLKLGDVATLTIQPPRAAIGRLSRDLDALLAHPEARSVEPEHYYLYATNYARGDANPPAEMASYRRVLKFINRLKLAATAFDPARQTLIFIRGEDRVLIPVAYGAAQLSNLDGLSFDGLETLFGDGLHEDQKHEILAQAILNLVAGTPSAQRFDHLLRNAGDLQGAVKNGYRLFVSNFSFAKVQNEVETAKLEFIGKIHKTVVDIQGQLLGIPIATFVVASQMKRAVGCSAEILTNVAVTAGAWIFLVMFLLAIANQWMTLDAIGKEIVRQRKKIERDFSIDLFTASFEALETRILVYRIGFIMLAAVALAGAVFASIAFDRLVDGPWWSCVRGVTALVPPAA